MPGKPISPPRQSRTPRFDCSDFCSYSRSRMVIKGNKRKSVRIACIGVENQHDSKPSHSIFIAIVRTHNPLVPGSNPGGPTICFQRVSCPGIVCLFATLPISLPMLRQSWLNCPLVESANRGLLRVRAYVRIVLEHLIADVPRQGANGLLRNVWAFCEPCNNCCSRNRWEWTQQGFAEERCVALRSSMS
jgi:hypothetical protein